MSVPLPVDRHHARRFARRAVGLEEPFPDVPAALAHLGYVQIDPINVCGRMHDLILRNRVAGYRPGGLMRALHGGDEDTAAAGPLGADRRVAFEHHLPDSSILVALTFDAWPHLLAAMQARARRPGAWAGKLTARERELAPALLAEIAARGPLGSEDFDDPRRARAVWGAAKLAKAVLQKLFFHGRLLIAGRVHNRRRYDLPERILPAAALARPAAAAADTARWLAHLKLRQRRLAVLKRTELAAVADLVTAVRVPECPPLHCLTADLPLLEAARDPRSAVRNSAPPRLLAPLDPLIYDRRVTAALWDFEYTWEVYTPPAKRTRGYYALPVLSGTELVGHIDPKADRAAGRLHVVSRQLRRGCAAAGAVRELARWLGLK